MVMGHVYKKGPGGSFSERPLEMSQEILEIRDEAFFYFLVLLEESIFRWCPPTLDLGCG